MKLRSKIKTAMAVALVGAGLDLVRADRAGGRHLHDRARPVQRLHGQRDRIAVVGYPGPEPQGKKELGLRFFAWRARTSRSGMTTQSGRFASS